MSDQMAQEQPGAVAPEMAPQGPPPLPNGTVVEDPVLVANALLRAVRVCAEDAAAVTGKDPRESKELGQAAQALAQAYVVLDPSRLAGGDTAEARRSSIPATRDGDHDGQIGEQ